MNRVLISSRFNAFRRPLQEQSPILRSALVAFIVFGLFLLNDASSRTWADEPLATKPRVNQDDFTTTSLRGQVVWMAEAMTRRHGVKSVAEASDRILALETANGQLHPLLEDVRGRAFRVDGRLRGIELELLVRQHHGSPMLQVIGVYAIEKGSKFEVDYWCDICAIAMYELKPCECCQGTSELRKRRIADKAQRAGQ